MLNIALDPSAAIVALDVLVPLGLDETADSFDRLQAEMVANAKACGQAEDLSGGRFALLSPGGWDLYTATGRWLGWCERQDDAEAKAAELAELFGA